MSFPVAQRASVCFLPHLPLCRVLPSLRGVATHTEERAHRGGKFQPPHPISFAKTSASQLISDHRSCTRSFPFARFWLVAAARI